MASPVLFEQYESTNDGPIASALSRSAPTTTERIRGLFASQFTKIVDAWFAIHLEHYGGKYSIERMLALEEYTQTTSFNRVLFVTIGLPLFVIGLVLLQESIPLQNPADGWAANYGFWIRAAFVGIGIGNAASIQIGFWLDVPPFSLKQILGYCTLMATAYVVAGMMAAMLWVFPIPFFMFSLCFVTSTVILVYIRLVVGPHGFRQILSRRQQLRRLNKVGMVQALMYVVYPAYQILFTKVSSTPYEAPVLMILPIIRLALKLIFASAAHEKEDMIPVQVVFTVDFFDAFYFASFIQSVSPLTLAGVMVIDLVQTASELYELNQRTRRILSRLYQLSGVQLQHINNLLEALHVAFNRIDTSLIKLPKTIQVRSCIYHQLSAEGRALLVTIERHSCAESCINSYQHNLKTLSTTAFVVPASDNTLKKPKTTWNKCFSRGKVAAEGVASTAPLPSSPKKDDIMNGIHQHSVSRKKSVFTASMVLKEALEVLFTSECLVLSEYMEVIVPTVYGLFVWTMVHLPSAEYHAELAGVNNDNVADIVSRIFAYAMMEFGSFVVLVVVKKRSCGINALYQLAFVLETQTLFVQSTLMMWILLTLTYRVVHFAHYGGKYSIERMLAFEEYTRNTSIVRVLLVVTGAPLIIIILVLCQEIIPLQDPADGWKANYGFWIRAGLVGVGVGYAGSIQIGFWLDAPSLSSKQIVVFCVAMGCGYIGAGMVLAELWVFPIPFFMFTLCMVTTSIVLVNFRIAVGAREFQEILTKREQLRRVNKIGSLQAFMYIVYPAYQVLFSKTIRSYYEFPVLLILPVFRLVVKVVFANAASHKEDMIPAQVVFTVDFFDAIYLATFLQTMSSITIAALMVVDLAQTASELHELHRQTRRMISQIQAIVGNSDRSSTNLLQEIRGMCCSDESLKQIRTKKVQVRSCFYHKLSEEGKTLLGKLERSLLTQSHSCQHNLNSRTASIHTNSILASDWINHCLRKRDSVQPHTSQKPLSISPTTEDIPKQSSRKIASTRNTISVSSKSIVLRKTLQILFTSECLILSEYLEIFVPTVYGTFIMAMINLPSAQYHTDLVGITHENVAGVVTRIFTYAFMEFASFVVLAAIVQRNCGINVLYQLAFVLETQMLFVQSMLMMWILMTMTYRVEHFGCDFSFQFSWIGNQE
ncbi:Hypothetical protein PHPALM_12015 [Phytophthora palmivora]|uniref:Transmembrane protein n=1 Tax=Phytophthora palmivora TaxID=4796 RepID=A0A2P4Y0U7_9STRA|nr:Hypothetical protein PHPALM_12015 [Phytophthora palmivora]